MGYYMDGTTQVWEPDAGGGLTSSGMSGLSSFGDLSAQIQANTQSNNAWSAEQAMKVSEFNAAEAVKNREWQKMMSDTAHQREVADLKAAGLNPVLSTRLAGASTPSGSAASGQKGDTDTSANSALTSLVGAFIQQENARLSAQTNLAIAERNNATSRLIAQISANASMNAAAMHANASRYAADLSAETSRYVSDNSGLQALNVFAHGLGYEDVGSMALTLGTKLGLASDQNYPGYGPKGHSSKSYSSKTNLRGWINSFLK